MQQPAQNQELMQQPSPTLNKSLSSDVGGADGLDGILPRSRSPVRNLSRGSGSYSPRRSQSPRHSSPKRPSQHSSPKRGRYSPARGAHDLESYAQANERIRSNSAAKREIIHEQKKQEREALEEAEHDEEEKLRE